MRLAAVACASVLLLPCASCARYRPPETIQVTRIGEVVTYYGPLSEEGLARLRGTDAAGAHTLLVQSGGGEVGASMDIGNWVRDHQLDVVVADYCVSSCANYVFLAGVHKWILPGGVVAWHGSARDAAIEDVPLAQRAKARAYLADVVPREEAFFRRIGVSGCIARVGVDRLGVNGFSTMSVEDMRRFGVTDIVTGPHDEKDIAGPWPSLVGVSFVRIPASLDPASC